MSQRKNALIAVNLAGVTAAEIDAEGHCQGPLICFPGSGHNADCPTVASLDEAVKHLEAAGWSVLVWDLMFGTHDLFRVLHKQSANGYACWQLEPVMSGGEYGRLFKARPCRSPLAIAFERLQDIEAHLLLGDNDANRDGKGDATGGTAERGEGAARLAGEPVRAEGDEPEPAVA
jgi:hypothetical protein